ncbi:transcription termination/antitermination NusG family protein [Thermodesulfobacteriota bacterium]
MTQYTETINNAVFTNNRQWFAVQTYIRKEQVAKINFEHQGFKVYLPLVKAVRRHARRVDYVERAFFKGYLFLHLSPTERKWETISSTKGAVKPVMFGGYYPPVPDRIIEKLCSYEDENGLISLDKINNGKFKQGDKVKISSPDAIEYTGMFKALRGNDRALILLDILKRQVTTVVPLSVLVHL